MSMLGPLPEGLRMAVCEAYDKSSYGRFMMCVSRVQDDSKSAQVVCADVFNILGFDGGRMHNGKIHRDYTSKSRRPDLYRMFLEWSTAAPAVVKQEKTDVPLLRMPGPLPEGLRMGVYEAYGSSGYGQFMRRVVALQEGTMSLEQVDDDVFTILGYDDGVNVVSSPWHLRDDFSKSHRPDLYRMFVEWSIGSPPVVATKKHRSIPFTFSAIKIPSALPETLCLDSLTSEVLVKDLIALEKAVHMTMSPTMQTALRIGLCAQGVPFSFGAMREMWLKELLKRVSFQKV